ncbi:MULTISPECIES: hypothetical protein [unclassified Frankia]|uniref:hypothetical protein n=1 Tax=unclassified Frankia TaxID=2632575 RepID=UPI0020248B3C
MTDQNTPYVSYNPGDLITAGDSIRLQLLIKKDIGDQIKAAIDGLTRVAQAQDAEKLAGLTPDALAAQVLEYVQRQLPKRTGYLSVLRRLEVGKESVIDHRLGAWPLVSVFQLDYFRVVASEDGHVFNPLATFYLHHSSESRIRFRPENTPASDLESVDVDPVAGHPYHIPWRHMLELYGVETPEDATLSEVESEFWSRFNAAPNDRFDDDQYFHSPWFDRCCGERRTVRQLSRDWDNIYFQMRPRLTLNLTGTGEQEGTSVLPPPAPSEVQVVQFGLQSIGLTLLKAPQLPASPPTDFPTEHLKVLVLLKV